MDKVLSRIDFWKQKLIDLSRRNRLIYFQAGRRSTLQVVQPQADDVFCRVVVNEEGWRFWQPSAAGGGAEDDGSDSGALTPAGGSPKPCEDDRNGGFGDLRPAPRAYELVCTTRDATGLTHTLRNLLRRSRTDFEERGLRILHLTFGMLQWQEAGSSDMVRSPLVVVPVELTRASAHDPYEVRPCEDELTLNPALDVKLATDFGIPLPPLPPDWEATPLVDYLAQVQQAVAKLGWTVVPEVWLGLFSFQKLVMYWDLDSHAELMSGHPTIRALGGEPEARGGLAAELPDERELDGRVDPRQSFLIADADSSQLACIEAVKAGTSLVVQGPPGTGKSQTITNIIAESIAGGRTVLFVSEKMAALEVVHKRLRERGLGSLTLELHSQKANKREVVQELERCYRQRLQPEGDLSELDLERLARRRRELNEYVQALHAVRHPLQQSAYEVLGQLARMRSAPLVAFKFAGVAELTPQRLDGLLGLGSRLSRVWAVALEGETYPWRGCREITYSNEVRQRYQRCVSEVLQAAQGLRQVGSIYAGQLGLGLPSSPEHHRWLVALGGLLGNRRPVEPAWFTQAQGSPLISVATAAAAQCDAYHETRAALSERYAADFFNLNPDLGDRLRTRTGELAAQLRGQPLEDPLLFASRRQLATWAQDLRERIPAWVRDGEQVAGVLGLPGVPWSLVRLRRLLGLVDLVGSGEHPDARWFEPATCHRLQAAVPRLRSTFDRYASLQAQLNQDYFPERLLELDLDSLVQSFAGRYARVFRFLLPGYYRDRSLVARCTRAGAAPPDCHGHLVVAREWKALRADMERESPAVEELLGQHFDGLRTDIAAVERALQVALDVLEWLGGDTVPDSIVQILSGRRNVPAALTAAASRLRQGLAEWDRGTAPLAVLLPLDRFPIGSGSLDHVDLTDLGAWAGNLAATISGVEECVAPVILAATGAVPGSVAAILADLGRLEEMRQAAQAVTGPDDQFRALFGRRYDGLETPWGPIVDSLRWVEEVRSHFGDGSPPEMFVAAVCDGGALASIEPLTAALNRWDQALAQLLGCFEDGWPHFAAGAGSDAVIVDLEVGFGALLDRMDGLQEWVDYKRLRQELEQSGLGDLMAELELNPPPAAELRDVLHKAVLQAWIDWLFASVPPLGRFRAGEHEERLGEFREMDVRHFELGANRVAARANQLHPKAGEAYSGGEIHTLLREANKKKRHLPLRRLFDQIPTLLQRLKPVLLMSPLSVSQFLQPEHLHFDVVVFDEASQIYAEDAVAAIYRGKQVVVCGDKKQLPPTAFFQLIEDGDDYPDEAADESTAEFDSILDECLALGMPERQLRWHYRSRHESLIAFSNRQFYESQLVTFPSAAHEDAEMGIKFEYVPDGVYDRGGSRVNRIEAGRVVDLVYDHFRCWPERSIGVIAFSQAQAQAIEDALAERRAGGSQFLYPATQDRLEGFFVKSLENVQGDERDVIIFSVGYGRDRQGRMTMGFGPLNTSGGERRLNVAVTRAREKVVLVSSIRAGDIDVAASRAGVLQLRKYLDYAERGMDALESGDASEGEAESPLEVSVANAIREMGYDLVPQVGCSGFRIDIGVVDPALPGRYLLGVECDGKAYHSSATARDRDRLRQQVLERLGWRIHRVWSPDWIHRHASEVGRLRQALAAAREAAEPSTRRQELLVPKLIDESPPSDPAMGWQAPYRCAKLVVSTVVTSEFHLPEYQDEQARLLRAVVAAEGPVHIEVATRRLREAWGLKRAGWRIQQRMRALADYGHRNAEFVLRAEFLWPAGVADVMLARVPDATDERSFRKVEHIPPEEIAFAMVSIAHSAIGIKADALLVETARVFGFAKTGPSIRDALDGVLRSLVAAGRLNDTEGHVSVVNS